MFIALICFVKTIIDFSNMKVFRKKPHDQEKMLQSKNLKKKRKRIKFTKKKNCKYCDIGMLDTATPRILEEYDGTVISRISDYNSNTYEKDDSGNVCSIDEGHQSYVSSTIFQDVDFIQDSSDYQWFADYSYRSDSNNICANMHTSILSSLCASYKYNDMARDLDANLAQVDMEDFRTEDIHSFLHGLPQICCTDVHNEKGGEMYANVSSSMMVKYEFDSSSLHSTSQDDSTGSIYKSEILFSPVKELPIVSFSIDSLDCEEHDIMLTCQANKDNYTIAFEGSTVMDKSTDSHCPNNEVITNTGEDKHLESVERMSLDTTSSENSNSAHQINKMEKTFNNKSPLICSESPYTTWSKLKVDSDENILKRQSSGNNNTAILSSSTGYTELTSSYAFLKSQSLPNLNPIKRQFLLSRKINYSTQQDQFAEKQLLQQPNQFMKLYSLSKSQCGRKIHRSVFQNNISFDLIRQFISNKHVVNEFMPDNQQSVCGMNSKFSKTVENLSQSTSLEKILERRVSDCIHENKVCDVFEDSLVGERFDEVGSDAFAVSDSCSSFSSHSGRIELLKKIANLEGKELSLPSETIRCSDFIRNKYLEKESKKRKLIKKCVNASKPIKIVDKSMQTSSSDADSAISPTSNKKNEVNECKPVYVMYPNYTLPDLSFLQEHATELDLKNVFLWPQKFSPSPTTEHASVFGQKKEPEEMKKIKKKRPCSCPDFESIKNKNYQHIRDWESLMFLLPREYCKVLTDDPELKKYIKNINDFGRSLICTSISSDHEQSAESEVKTTCVSTCSTGTQPSSGYRGSSTMLSTDSNGSTVKCEEQGKSYANRPPLPRGILRNPVLQNIKSKKNLMNTKRYSMFEFRKDDEKSSFEKRRSLPSQFTSASPKKLHEKDTSCSEDEGVDSSGSHCDSPGPNSDQDARRLEYLLETAFHWNEDDTSQLKNQSSKKTVSFADRHSKTPPNSPNSSVSGQQRSSYQVKLYSVFDMGIHAECEGDRHSSCDHIVEQRTSSYNFKKELIDAVEEAKKCIFTVVGNQETMSHIALNHLCPALYAILNHGLKPTLETVFGDITNSVWQVVEASAQQGLMTRALHELVLRLNNDDVLTEGVMKFNAFIFGLLNVRGLDTWLSYLRTRESVLRKHYTDTGILISSCKGIMSDRQLTDQLLSSLKPLSDLSFKLDLLYECRQLHRSLMQLEQNSPVQSGRRTSRVLKKIVRSLQNATGNSKEKDSCSDELRNSAVRPRSCIDSSNGFTLNDIASTVKRRWSGIQFGSKLASAFERLAIEDDETYTDSLDYVMNDRDEYTSNNNVDYVTSSVNNTDLSVTYNEIYNSNKEHEELPSGELKFKQLQKKWEMLVEKRSPENISLKDTFSSRTMEESNNVQSSTKSRIPRLVTSPVRPQSGFHFSVLPSSKTNVQLKKASPTSPTSNIPMAVCRKPALSPTGVKRLVEPDTSKIGRMKSVNTHRLSRIDQNMPSSLPLVRPNSLSQSTSTRFQRKTVDDGRRPTSSGRRLHIASRYVRTLSHRLPSDTGHLSYNEGEKLRVVLDVDDKWILCCRGDQKGLVPRSAVLPVAGHL